MEQAISPDVDRADRAVKISADFHAQLHDLAIAVHFLLHAAKKGL